jgi:hypothetical protein
MDQWECMETKCMIIKLTNASATGFLQFKTAFLVFQTTSPGKHPDAGNQIQDGSIRAKSLKILIPFIGGCMIGERMRQPLTTVSKQ